MASVSLSKSNLSLFFNCRIYENSSCTERLGRAQQRGYNGEKGALLQCYSELKFKVVRMLFTGPSWMIP